MAKRSHKRRPRPEKDPTGCMWGLINMFDFRQGHSATKLISDRKRGSSRHFGTKNSRNKLKAPSNFEDTQAIDNFDERRRESVNVTTSIRTLVEEDMSRLHASKPITIEEIEEIEEIRPERGLDPGKNYKQTTKIFTMVSDIVNDLRDNTSLESQKSNCMSPTERPSINFDLAAFMQNFYGDGYQCHEKHVDYENENDQSTVSKVVDHTNHYHLKEPDPKLAEKQILLHKSLVDVADVFLSQKFIDTKQVSRDVQSQEFMDALEILNTNKELLLSLLQDPNSLLLELVHAHQNAQVGKLSHQESDKYLSASEPVEQIGTSGQCEQPITSKLLNEQCGCKLFRKKNKSKGTKSPGENDSSNAFNKILILKPSQSRVQNSFITPSPSYLPQPCPEDGERVASRFSLTEIKRRFRKVMGSRKERQVISMEGIMHRIPYGSKNSGDPGKHIARDGDRHALESKTSKNTKDTSQFSTLTLKGDKKDNRKEHQQNMKNEKNTPIAGNDKRVNMEATIDSLNRESFNEEAKKHLAMLIDTGHNHDIMQIKSVSKSLGRLLSFSEYNISPKFSPIRDKGSNLSATEICIQDDPTNSYSALRQDLEKMSGSNDNPDDKADVRDASYELMDIQTKGLCIVEDLNQKGSTELVEKTDTKSKEDCDRPGANSESGGSEPEVTSERCIEERSPTYSGKVSASLPVCEHSCPSKEKTDPYFVQGSPRELSPETPRLSNSCSSVLKQIIKDPESILNKLEQPSPISVLEPLFLEDANNSGSELGESPMCPQSTDLEEHDNPAVALKSSDSENNPRNCVNDIAGRFEYVRAVLEISGLSCNNVSDTWLSAYPLLKPSLFNEVGISFSELSDDPELLFDCISEVLVEIQERFFSCTPWVPFIKHNVRPVPIGGNLIQEVCKVIERNLQLQSPYTLDQIVKKDMDGGNWMELWSETQSIVTEMVNAILDDLSEETALELLV